MAGLGRWADGGDHQLVQLGPFERGGLVECAPEQVQSRRDGRRPEVELARDVRVGKTKPERVAVRADFQRRCADFFGRDPEPSGRVAAYDDTATPAVPFDIVNRT